MRPRMVFLRAAAFMLVVVACQQGASTSATSAPLSDSDRAALRAAFDSTVSRIRARNFAAWTTAFTEDGVLMPPNHPSVRGRAAMQAWADSLPPITQFDFSDVQVDGAGDVAYGTSGFEMTMSPAGAAAMADRGKQLVVFRRQADGSWLVAVGAFSSDLPIVPPAPPAPPKKG